MALQSVATMVGERADWTVALTVGWLVSTMADYSAVQMVTQTVVR